MKFGIENLKLLIGVILSFITIGDKMGHENNWTSRWAHLVGFLPSLMSLGSINWSLLDDEVKDIDDSEKEEIRLFVNEKFDILDDKLEETIEEALAIAAQVGSFVKVVSEFVKKIKAFFK